MDEMIRNNYRGVVPLRPDVVWRIRLIIKRTTKTTANNWAICEKVPASPPKPRKAASIANRKNVIA